MVKVIPQSPFAFSDRPPIMGRGESRPNRYNFVQKVWGGGKSGPHVQVIRTQQRAGVAPVSQERQSGQLKRAKTAGEVKWTSVKL